MSICEVKGLCKNYPGFSLKDVSFSLEAGSITGFIGRNGAGKTTTIKSMLNFVMPDKGEIEYFGMPLKGNEREIKKRIGYSTGALSFYPRKKVKDLVSVMSSFYESWSDETYRHYLDIFEIDETKAPYQLSDGMKVKVNLLLALSHGAEILILDEPTSGLDPFARDEINDVFKMLKEKGVAIFFSTHITSDIEKCADSIVYIRKGEIVCADTTDGFREKLGQSGETLEDTMLRLEKEARK